MDFKNIPIFIISYNRLNDLQTMIDRLNQDGYKNIIVVDNASDDIALLQYLRSLNHRVEFLDKNYGHKVVWESGLFNDIIDNSYYVVTDPDILPTQECPDDYVEMFWKVLNNNPEVTKVGFSLKICDLPEQNPNRMDIIRWESFFYENIISKDPLLYKADIDTTFALYKPGRIEHFFSAIRTGRPYEARHLPWYWGNDNLNKETKNYLKKGNMCGNTYSNPDNIKKLNYQMIKKIMDEKLDLSECKLTIYISYIDAHSSIYIYGAGVVGVEIAKTLLDKNYHIDGFLVSEKTDKSEVLGIKIFEFKEKKEEIKSSNAGIILATTLVHKMSILHALYSQGCTDVCSIEL